MSRIQTSVGLYSGVDIVGTVDKLMAVAARPRDALTTRNKGLTSQSSAVTELMALATGVQYVAKNLGKERLYTAQSASSSDTATVGATVTGSPAAGTYRFTSLQTVQHQQWLANGAASRTEPLGAGQLTFRFGSGVQRSLPLELTNGGTGFSRGKIRITDRSGATADIDLSTAATLDDVLAKINNNGTVRVTASAAGDAIRLTDQTGQTVSNLRVQEVGNGRTAASLGLASIDAAAASATGSDLVRLYAGLSLREINGGNGAVFNTALPDVQYTLRDGTTGTIDFSPILNGSSTVDADRTLGDALERINAALPAKLKAEIAPGGDRLVLTDLTAGGGSFQLQAINGSSALADLGIDSAASGGTITGRRLLAGLQGSLLSDLGGGRGLGTLGTLNLTDRAGASATVDLSGSETLGDMLDRINAAGVGISARVNRAGYGIELTDTTGQSGNLIVASGSGQTAEKLGIAVNAAAASINSGDLHLQVVSENTRLTDYNGGAGVGVGSFTLTDSTGAKATVSVTSSDATLGDVIRKINQSALHIHAEINQTGDGIALRDTGQGAGTLSVSGGSSSVAKSLRLLAAATTTNEQGIATQVIDGRTTTTITWDAAASLNDVLAKINEADAGLAASVLTDGSAQPYRLALSSRQPGRSGNLLIDDGGAGFSLEQTAAGRDALMLFGTGDAAGGILASSSSNYFTGLVEGLRLEAKQASEKTVTVTVASSDTDFTASVKTLVDNYNKFRNRLGELTAYDSQTETSGVLAGDPAAIRLESEIPYLLSGRFGSGQVRSLAELGVTFKDDGTLELDETKLKQKFAENRDAVEQFFTAADTGFSARLDQTIKNAAGEGSSLLENRLKAMTAKIDQNQQRIDSMTAQLAAQRERLLNQFYQMELAISKMQSGLNALSSITGWSTSSSSSSSS